MNRSRKQSAKGQMTGRRKVAIWAAVMVVIGLFAACGLYLGDYYHAEEAAIAALEEIDAITVTELKNGDFVFELEGAKVGLIFYPGGKVEHTAYIPLMQECAKRGMLCVLVKMPFHLAVLDINAADGIPEAYPAIDTWYIGGHSLGGSMAASCLEKHTDAFDGLVLLGAYSTADLSDSGRKVLSIYGSEDRVLNRESYEENRRNLPEDYREVVIAGGCHAFFGVYGPQDGDGTPSITNEEQISIAAEEIGAFAFSNVQ